MNLFGFLVGVFLVWMSKQEEIINRDGEWFWSFYLCGWGIIAFSVWFMASQGVF